MYNPNRVEARIEELLGVVEYENEQIGSFSFPDFTPKGKSVTDVIIDIEFILPPPTTVLDMAEDYMNDELSLTLRLDIAVKVAGFFSASKTDFQTELTTGISGLEDGDEKGPKDISLCKCQT